MRPADDEGSATVWALAGSALLMAATYAALLLTVAVGARHRAEAAADLAALAGAAAVQDGADGCAAAATVATANEAALRTCRPQTDGSLVVGVTVALPEALRRWASSPVMATARAGS